MNYVIHDRSGKAHIIRDRNEATAEPVSPTLDEFNDVETDLSASGGETAAFSSRAHASLRARLRHETRAQNAAHSALTEKEKHDRRGKRTQEARYSQKPDAQWKNEISHRP